MAVFSALIAKGVSNKRVKKLPTLQPQDGNDHKLPPMSSSSQ